MEKEAPALKFKALKPYILYLSNHLMKEVADEYLHLLNNEQLPLINFFAHLEEKPLQKNSLEFLQEFFDQILNDKALEQAYGFIDKWKKDKLSGFFRKPFEGADIVVDYAVRRKLFLKFLPQYTQDCYKIIEIMNEVEELFIHLEKISIQIFTEIQHEEINKRNEFLSSLINNSVDGVSVYDTEMNVQEWNPVLEKQIGIKKGDILGKNFFEIFPTYQETEEAKAIEKVLRGGKRLSF